MKVIGDHLRVENMDVTKTKIVMPVLENYKTQSKQIKDILSHTIQWSCNVARSVQKAKMQYEGFKHLEPPKCNMERESEKKAEVSGHVKRLQVPHLDLNNKSVKFGLTIKDIVFKTA